MRTIDREQYLNAISVLPIDELLSLRDRTAGKYPQLKTLIDTALEGKVHEGTQMVCDHFAIGGPIHAKA